MLTLLDITLVILSATITCSSSGVTLLPLVLLVANGPFYSHAHTPLFLTSASRRPGRTLINGAWCATTGLQMAEKDNVGFQEFPNAAFNIPRKELMEELSAMTQNLMEGHQGVGEEKEDDPYSKAVHYLEKHRIVEILQVTIETGLLRFRPH